MLNPKVKDNEEFDTQDQSRCGFRNNDRSGLRKRVRGEQDQGDGQQLHHGSPKEKKAKKNIKHKNSTIYPWMLECRSKERKETKSKPLPNTEEKQSTKPMERTSLSQKQFKYTQKQLFELEKEFHTTPYLSSMKRGEIAKRLDIGEKQVKVWFQNRRMRLKRETKKDTKLDQGGKTEKISRVLHYFNNIATTDDKSGITHKDLQEIDAIINKIYLKRLPSKTIEQGDRRLINNLDDPNACFPYAQLPPNAGFTENIPKFKHFDNSGFEKFAKNQRSDTYEPYYYSSTNFQFLNSTFG